MDCRSSYQIITDNGCSSYTNIACAALHSCSSVCGGCDQLFTDLHGCIFPECFTGCSGSVPISPSIPAPAQSSSVVGRALTDCTEICYGWDSPEGCRQCLDCPDGCKAETHQNSRWQCVGDYCTWVYTYDCHCEQGPAPDPTRSPMSPTGRTPTSRPRPRPAAGNTSSSIAPAASPAGSQSGAVAMTPGLVGISMAGTLVALM
jgi:hypothetical protein